MLELLSVMVCSLLGKLEVRLLKTVLLGMILCNKQFVLEIRVAKGLCF